MASAAQKKMAVVCLMLLAVGLMVDATDKPTSCTDSVKNDSPPDSDCICSKNCACAGKCILMEPASVQSCFIDCVLKNDCICEDKKNGADQPQ
ncbi:hypothetical protein BDA96_06G008000 [Sorghum bicolor]|jgi:hypothetical protein|uniref:Uncharacterized protein n=2 Tax=Sorghum bicolor TaxID=4558 RepID=A0A921QNC1_SORBI|nr:uncharacterized protein LOC8080256 [Sorghum bicolor]EES11750.1 hypothetical protein SORBI_3006G007300 [Sorghum bicolor]KAG0524898.1 hypothetical protein BDA96_06G008000 [Sorghum bicolor]|eukprot:XP_002447422.1 uncharacterized protein LOC8080256 [Sorghum bicolor]